MSKVDAWYRTLADIGCIVCLNTMGVRSPPDMHHIHLNGRRVDDYHTIPLCYIHHRSGINNQDHVSRHPWKKEFERRYGTEWDLYEQVKHHAEILLQVQPGVPGAHDEDSLHDAGKEDGA
jgi:hypothetical protein